MVFSSELFLFIFLPLVFVLYRLIPRHRAKNVLLTIVSLVFYAWGQPVYVLLLLFSVTCNYLAGRMIMSGGTAGYKKSVLVVSVAVNLLLLGVFKYLDFFVDNINLLFGLELAPVGLTLPIGISFFTFQGLSYVIDVYRQPDMGSRSYMKILLYISFFPQLVAGPIIKYHDVSAQIDGRSTNPAMTAEGIRRFIVGLSKKLLIANMLGQAADTVFSLTAGQLDARLAWLGAVCYTLQIYFDFSGYSDMAIGMGKMFGFQFKENFDHPYCSASITEFWRRWHISLSTWFKEYLYIPLGGNRRGELRTGINKALVFFLSGLWHGANWTFVIWGMLHGLLILIEYFLKKDSVSLFKRIPGIVYTLFAVVVSFVFFRADDLASAGLVLSAMFGFIPAGSVSAGIWRTTFTPVLAVTLAVAAAACIDFNVILAPRLQGDGAKGILRTLSMAGALVLYGLCILNLASTSFNPFIYFQF